MTNFKQTTTISTYSIENLLLVLPKKCSCHLCETTKNEAKKNLGEKKYKVICNSLGIWN